MARDRDHSIARAISRLQIDRLKPPEFELALKRDASSESRSEGVAQVPEYISSTTFSGISLEKHWKRKKEEEENEEKKRIATKDAPERKNESRRSVNVAT